MQNNQPGLAVIHLPNIESFVDQVSKKAWIFDQCTVSKFYKMYSLVLSGFTPEGYPIKMTIDCGDGFTHQPIPDHCQHKLNHADFYCRQWLSRAGIEVHQGLLGNLSDCVIASFPKHPDPVEL